MRSRSTALVILSVFAQSIPAVAHHSQAMYDSSRELSVVGTVTEFQWTNPHTWLHVTVRDETGTERVWTFESNSTGQLLRIGWREDAIKAGDEVTIIYRPLRDGTRGGSIRVVHLPDGGVLRHVGIGGYDPVTGVLNTAP